jgi:hypothetical protein
MSRLPVRWLPVWLERLLGLRWLRLGLLLVLGPLSLVLDRTPGGGSRAVSTALGSSSLLQ